MRRSRTGPAVGAGLTLHILVAGLMLFAGSGKLFGFAPAKVIDKLQHYGLADRVHLIGIGEVISAVLLLFPRTVSLGILMTSGFWGGVICIHMAHHDSLALPIMMLLLTWLGGICRESGTLASMRRWKRCT
jgi:hypothetical protein